MGCIGIGANIVHNIRHNIVFKKIVCGLSVINQNLQQFLWLLKYFLLNKIEFFYQENKEETNIIETRKIIKYYL